MVRRERLDFTERRPPLPPQTEWGTCRWCLKPILKDDKTINKKKKWHKECKHKYLLELHADYAKWHIRKEQNNKCAMCGFDFYTYSRSPELDHIIPLWKGGSRRRKNLWVICGSPCHKNKTAKEAKERAILRQKKNPVGSRGF